MDELIVARHGDYTNVGAKKSLTDNGKKSMSSLATKIINKGLIMRKKVLILYPNLQRAEESAKILASRFNCKALAEVDLSGSHLHGIFQIVEKYAKDYDIIILVLQNDDIKKFPTYYAKHKFDILIEPPDKAFTKEWPLGYGYAWILDFDKKSVKTSKI